MSLSAIKDHIFIFDLHNTLYDEVIEYGGAMKAACDYLINTANDQGATITSAELYSDIAAAHAKAGSDWDADIWNDLPCLAELSDKNKHIAKAKQIRTDISKELTCAHRYNDTIEALHILKDHGARLFLATEATSNAASDAVRWLNLDGVFEAVYSWPYDKPYDALERTPQKPFPLSPSQSDFYVQKPHALIIAKIIIDTAKADEVIPDNITIDDIFNLTDDRDMDLGGLISKLPEGHIQGREVINAIKAQLEIKQSEHKEIIEDYIKRSYFIGDSFFKDGFLARNAGLPFIHAAYGKQASDKIKLEEAKEVLYAVTGWEPFLLQLTQEAARLPELTQMIVPYLVCNHSLMDLIKELKRI